MVSYQCPSLLEVLAVESDEEGAYISSWLSGMPVLAAYSIERCSKIAEALAIMLPHRAEFMAPMQVGVWTRTGVLPLLAGNLPRTRQCGLINKSMAYFHGRQKGWREPAWAPAWLVRPDNIVVCSGRVAFLDDALVYHFIDVACFAPFVALGQEATVDVTAYRDTVHEYRSCFVDLLLVIRSRQGKEGPM